MASGRPGAGVSIRRVSARDAAALFAFRLHAVEVDPDAFLRTFAEEQAAGVERMAAMLAETERTAVFVACRGVDDGVLREGDILGMVGVYREIPSKWSHRALVWGMFVEGSARGQGIGGALLDAAIRHAREALGVRQVYLSAEGEHRVAIALYESRGFVVWGREPRGTMDGERGMEEIHLTLMLS